MQSQQTTPQNASAAADTPHARAKHGIHPDLWLVDNREATRWPIDVPRRPGESHDGWLRRIGHRYGISGRAALDALGIPMRAQVHPNVDTLTASHRLLFEAAGFNTGSHPANDLTLRALDHRYWSRIRAREQRLRSFQFCPECLNEDPVWWDTWRHPVHVACVRHGVLLSRNCAACGGKPFNRPSWSTYDGPVTACTDFINNSTDERRYRERCSADLGDQTSEPAPPELLAAQQWLFTIVAAHRNAEPMTVIGLETSATTAYRAVAEILRTNCTTRPSGDLADVSEALQAAHVVLTRPNVGEAAAAMTDLSGLDGQAPLKPFNQSTATWSIRNPINKAIHLQQKQGRIAHSAELTYRVGTHAPCEPAPKNTSAPNEFVPCADLPELPLQWLPRALWIGSLSLGDNRTDDELGITTPVGRAFGAMALGRFGSRRTWRFLAAQLGLPASAAKNGGSHWRAIENSGMWPRYVQAIGELFENIHQSPPPIDYARRRAINLQDIRREARTVVYEYPGDSIDPVAYAYLLETVLTASECDPVTGAIGSNAVTVPKHYYDRLTESARRLGLPPDEPLSWQPP